MKTTKVSKANTAKKQNEKNLPIADEKTFSESDEESKSTENITVSNRNGDLEPMKEGNDLEINHFFNELPVRILNSHQLPFFYAEDICTILGIKQARKTLLSFTEEEIVSPELRQKYNIITYKVHRGKKVIDNRKILLTEFGVYRLLMNSRSQLADQFRTFVYRVLYQLRTVGEYKVKAKLEQLQITNELLRKDIAKLEQKKEQFKNLCDEIILMEFPNNPYEILPTNVPSHMRKKSMSARTKHNSIDDPVPHALRLAQELGKVLELIDITTAPTSQWKSIHDGNIISARQFIQKHSPPNSYLVVSKPSPEQLANGNVIHRVYVKDRTQAMRKLSQLIDFKPDNVSSKSNWYSCNKEKIIEAMDAIED